jgi:hypothetical protein
MAPRQCSIFARVEHSYIVLAETSEILAAAAVPLHAPPRTVKCKRHTTARSPKGSPVGSVHPRRGRGRVGLGIDMVSASYSASVTAFNLMTAE